MSLANDNKLEEGVVSFQELGLHTAPTTPPPPPTKHKVDIYGPIKQIADQADMGHEVAASEAWG
jgi:hypothetical protein